jgi:hypothetical protein
MSIDMTHLAELAAAAPEWRNREDREQIAPDRWGKDHWSLLAYVESVGVEYKGRIDWRRLTLSARNWPMLYAARDHGAALGRYTGDFGSEDSADKYGLRLRRINGQPVTLYGHCEADALMDMVDAGLVTITMPGVSEDDKHFLKPNGRPLDGEDDPRPGLMTGLTEWQLMPWARFRLTDLGRAVANELRAHKSTDGATWSNFEPTTLRRAAVVSGEVVKTVEG